MGAPLKCINLDVFDLRQRTDNNDRCHGGAYRNTF